ncbi:MAG: chitobiase/beta-hexosaminidase C-terminal domain-containing protein [Muribaculaceae bacterium]|nr:chitobiase/beta-hexosaminidase C-terminal domain-containing protein [Muribaculaceae bacterium]
MMMMMPNAAFENLHLNLSIWDEAASIWYTLDAEAAPEDIDAWTLYTEPIALDSDCTVRFFGRRSGFLDSQISSYEFVYADWQTAAPEITEDTDNNAVVISCATEGAVIRYTTDGSEPTEESSIYQGPLSVENGTTVRAKAFADGLFDSEMSELVVTGMDAVETISIDGIKVCKEAGMAVVYSDRAMTISVFTLDGRIVRTVNVAEGRNVIDGLDSGLYLIGNVRIKL